MQSPDPSGVAPKESFATGATLHFPASGKATLAHAGNWVFRLTATDNDKQANSSFTKEAPAVTVNAPPQTNVSSEIKTTEGQLVLSAKDAVDPDTDVKHTRLDGAQPVVSGGIVKYTWWLSEAPLEWPGGAVSGSLERDLRRPGRRHTNRR